MERDHYQQEMLEHYKRTQRESQGFPSNVCPTTEHKPCRLCDLCKNVFFDKKTDGTPLRERAKELNAKERYFSNITFAANPSSVIIFEYGNEIFKYLIGWQVVEESDYTNFFHPELGRNVIIIKTPGATPRLTKYSAEARAQVSRMTDLGVLQHLPNLSNVKQVLTMERVNQSKLQSGRTEVRFMPSWLGPQVPMFYAHVKLHFGIAEDEFLAVLRGELDPFSSATAQQITQPAPVTSKPIATPADNPWGNYGGAMASPPGYQLPTTNERDPGTEDVIHEDDKSNEYPICYGEYEADSQECQTACKEDGWAEGCKKDTFDREERRKKARKLYK